MSKSGGTLYIGVPHSKFWGTCPLVRPRFTPLPESNVTAAKHLRLTIEISTNWTTNTSRLLIILLVLFVTTSTVEATLSRVSAPHRTENRVPTLLLTKKSRTFPGLSRTPWKIFQDLFGARKWLNIKKKRHLLTIFRVRMERQRCQNSTFHTVFK